MAESQEAVYLEFLQYDWDSFLEFQEGLNEILMGHLALLKEQDPSVQAIPPHEQQQLIDQAKLFFYCSKTGNILNLDDYYAWKRNNGDKISLVDDKPVGEQESNAPGTNDSKLDSAQLESGQEEAPYSSNYQNLVDLIVSGKPVPGIKQIPDTVLSDQGSKLEAKSRVKPWEKQNGENPAPAADIQEMTL